MSWIPKNDYEYDNDNDFISFIVINNHTRLLAKCVESVSRASDYSLCRRNTGCKVREPMKMKMMIFFFFIGLC